MIAAGSHEKVYDSVYLVGGNGLSDGSDCLVYLLDLGDLILIDCGAGRSWPRIAENIRSTGRDPASLHSLVLTHGHVDHIGAAAQIQKETGCRVLAHQKDARAIETGDPQFTVSNLYNVALDPIKLDQIISSEQEVLSFSNADITLIHTPGHTPGSLVVLYEIAQQKILFGQDIHGPFSPAFESDLEAWKTSLHKLLDLEVDILCEGHYGIFQPASKVAEFIQEQLATPRSMMPVPVPL
jgi:glyoxylase-like metal-dependent hydrolase (beta-lactamase superfamily II)